MSSETWEQLRDENAALRAERDRLAEALAESRRLEDLGRMAVGVAHDFNHVLTVISLSLEHGGKGDELREALAYGRELVASLLASARGESAGGPAIGAEVEVEVDAVIGALAPVLAAAIGKELALELDLRAGGGRAQIAPVELRRLVVNMVTNAADATRGHGGRVGVATQVLEGGAVGAAGTGIELRIEDDGRGMDEATRARVFEPFFTTKAPGEGTGIGLATCRSIVERVGGSISVESEPGAGAVFRIVLPATGQTGDTEERRASGPGDRQAAPGIGPVTGRVLLVEDSPTIGRLLSDGLRGAGHDVVHVTTLAAARAALDEGEFGVVVVDLQLPDGRGEDIIAAARARGGDTAIVVASGEAAAIPGADAAVMKPFSVEELVAGIGRAIGHRRETR